MPVMASSTNVKPNEINLKQLNLAVQLTSSHFWQKLDDSSQCTVDAHPERVNLPVCKKPFEPCSSMGAIEPKVH